MNLVKNSMTLLEYEAHHLLYYRIDISYKLNICSMYLC